MNEYAFENVRHALCWSTEHLRSRTFPKVSKIYMSEQVGNVSEKDAKNWGMWRQYLPQDAEECYLLSMKVYKAVYGLSDYDKSLILMKYWGDYHDKNYLKSALNIKEGMRLRGEHVRLNYRFSVRQIASAKNENYSKIHRALTRIESELEVQLAENGLILSAQEGEVKQNALLERQDNAWDVTTFRNT